MYFTKYRLLFVIITLLLFSGVVWQLNASGNKKEDVEIGIVEKLNEYIPDNIYVTGEDGRNVKLTDLIDKPTVLNFVYYRCPGICSPLMEGVAEVMDKSDMKPGVDYQVLTISFDPRETIDLAVRKKANYLNMLSKKEEIAVGWKFFVADSANIVRATDAVGFRYKKTGNDFAHAASIVIVSPEGKITRYLNGIYFLPFEFKMAVVEAGKGQPGPTINKILQYCYSYDPTGEGYVLNVTKVSATVILFFGLIFFLFLILKPKRKPI